MANPDHLARLYGETESVGRKFGGHESAPSAPESWNLWRRQNPDVIPDLRDADLRGSFLNMTNLANADLRGANLRRAHLCGADLTNANLSGAFLNGADLREAKLRKSNLHKADLQDAVLKGVYLQESNLADAFLGGADLSGATLRSANLRRARLINAQLNNSDLSGADLHRADLTNAHLVEVNIDAADLSHCSVYGISVWNLKGTPKDQSNLSITRWDDPRIVADNLEVAQFIYLMLHNEKLRNLIETVTSKAVLILGRFTPERKSVLDAVRSHLRKRNLVPILFDFAGPNSRDITETVTILAHLARFIIADLTDPRSIPQELTAIIPALPSVPVQPLLLKTQKEYGMFEHLRRYPWVLDTVTYSDAENLISLMDDSVIGPAEAKVKDLRKELGSN